MKNIIFLFLISLLCSCGLPMEKVKQNPELMEYAKPILEEAAKRNKNLRLNTISFRFANDKDNALGSCVISYRLNFLLQKYVYGKEIRINEQQWRNSSELTRLQLIEHEIGHCAIGRSHNIVKINSDLKIEGFTGGITKSIMYPSKMPDMYYQGLQEYYYEELFNPSVNSYDFITQFYTYPISYYSEYTQSGLCPDGTWCGSSTMESPLENHEMKTQDTHQETNESSCEKHIMEDETDNVQYTDKNVFEQLEETEG